MSTTRRGFLGAISTAIVGACVARDLPIGWLPAPVKKQGAVGYLTLLYNNFYKKTGRRPRVITVPQELFEQLKSEFEVIQRFTSTASTATESLMFKACTVEVSATGMTLLT